MRERFSTALKEAMRAKNERAVSTIRLMMAALKDREIAARGRGEDGVSEAEILGMLQTSRVGHLSSVGICLAIGKSSKSGKTAFGGFAE